MQRKIYILFYLLFFFACAFAQEKKEITLEDLWAKGTFRTEYLYGLEWMKDEQHFTSLERRPDGTSDIVKYSIAGNGAPEVLVKGNALIPEGEDKSLAMDAYTFSPDEQKLLIMTSTEQIYRRSSRSVVYLFDLKSRKLVPLSGKEPLSYPTFSPDGSRVAFVRNNDIFWTDLASMKETRITRTGIINKIINGSTDWVYEEEFEFTHAFFWAPDSRKIAYYTFDESEVREYNMQLWDGLYPTDYRFKYPKAGEKNSYVDISCYFTETGKTTTLISGQGRDQYIPRIKWTRDELLLSIMKMNRLQNELEILHANVSTGEITVAYMENNKAYIEVNDDLTYLEDGQHFLLSSESDGFRHIYLYRMNGEKAAQLTSGKWEVAEFLGADERRGLVYFTSTEASHLERHLYSVDLQGENKKKYTEASGTHHIEMSPSFTWYLDYYSAMAVPPRITLYKGGSGEQVKTFISNEALQKKMKAYRLRPAEFFTFAGADQTTLHGWMIRPDTGKKKVKSPVLIFTYSGPGSQQVKKAWTGPNFFWFQMLAQKGYVVVCVDTRGTGGRGEAFKKITQHQLGKYETEDLIAAAQYLKTQPYIDPQRIGVFGWSYGGYLSSLCMTMGAEHFKAGIAVAPVTSWRFYDTIYTERFLGLPQDNPSGYDDNSPITHAGKLKGNYLLVHGTADDNVHVQNSFAMQDALIAANKPHEVFYYPDRNHGIYGGKTRLHLYEMMTAFLLKNL